MIEDILPLVLAFVSLFAFILGGHVRNVVHMVWPFQDPVSMLLWILCALPFVLDHYGYRIFNPYDMWYIAFVVAFVLCYCVAYFRGEFNMVYIDTHTIVSEDDPDGAQDTDYYVYYWNKDGQMCLQEQTIRAALKSLCGIHCPLRLDIGQIRRARRQTVHFLGLPKKTIQSIDMVEKNVTESIVQKGPFKFKVRSYAFTPSPGCIDTTADWLVSAAKQQVLVKELVKKECKILDDALTVNTVGYQRAADLLTELINDRTPSAEIYNELAARLMPEVDQQSTRLARKLADGEDAQAQAPKKNLFKRKKEAEE